jgi:hypothetical protein
MLPLPIVYPYRLTEKEIAMMRRNHFVRKPSGKRVEVWIEGKWYVKPVLSWDAKIPLVEHEGIRYNPAEYNWRYPLA